MVGAVLLPAAIFSAVALGLLLKSERESAHRSVYETAKLVSLAVDRELSRAESAMRVLASSEKLTRGELEAFHERLSRGKSNTQTWTLLSDASGKLLLNSRLPYATPLPPGTEPSQVAAILADTRAVASDMFMDANSERLVVTLNVPVQLLHGNYVLSQAFLPEYFNKVLMQTRPPSNWIIGLFDGQAISIARTHRAQEFVGKPVNPQLFKASRLVNVGEQRLTTREGIEVFNVFVRSPVSGWTIAVGVPNAELEAPALRAVLIAALGLVATLMFGAWLALRDGTRLARSIDRAAEAASMIGRSDVPPEPGLRLKEIDSLHEAMQKAHVDLLAEKQARALAETDREALYAREQSARAEAEAQNKSKDAFLAMLGHELRNPLSAISGAMQVIKLTGTAEAGNAATRQAHEIIERQTGHLSHMVDDLLDVSRVISGKIQLDCQPVDLSGTVRRVLAAL